VLPEQQQVDMGHKMLGLNKLSFCNHVSKGLVECKCGENLENSLEWSWNQSLVDHSAVEVFDNGAAILFHPQFSTGTACAVGNTMLQAGYQHYWEVKITRPCYGTDFMVGVATRNFDVAAHKNVFSSAIGKDSESWGLSYQGFIQHAEKKQQYVDTRSYVLRAGSTPTVFLIGSLVGVHLDTFRGTLEFYINRQSLGVAFSGLKNKELYPVVCSTAAGSGLKLTCARSFRSTLQFNCIKLLSRKYCPDGSCVLPVCLPPGLAKFVKNNYWFLLDKREELTIMLDDTYETDDSITENDIDEQSISTAAAAGKSLMPATKLSWSSGQRVTTTSRSHSRKRSMAEMMTGAGDSDSSYDSDDGFHLSFRRVRSRKRELYHSVASTVGERGAFRRHCELLSCANTTQSDSELTDAAQEMGKDTISESDRLTASTPTEDQEVILRSDGSEENIGSLTVKSAAGVRSSKKFVLSKPLPPQVSRVTHHLR